MNADIFQLLALGMVLAVVTLLSLRLNRPEARAADRAREVVREAGGAPEHVGRLTIYVTDKHEYNAKVREIGAAYRAHMGKHFPAMALVQVAALLEDRAKVEIEATAVIP